ncbi:MULTISPECIES: 6,7-dimethyl-8-ribityllumazine synthase [Micrococcales]|uniref:6,7-dimethyl-8-ribityllumazine synthase n=1 Tax=Micrococcales TaxID=85006 RepID=UPI0004A9FA4F|nr:MULTISPECIES: 6,7-dimethyl-8-ribityllumazine synthase [Micrococcales]
MSSNGLAVTNIDDLDVDGLKIAVVAASWHDKVMDGLLGGAQRALRQVGLEEAATFVRVAGAFELSVVSQELARTHDGVVALGVVIRGGTPHFDYVCAAACDGLGRVALDTGKAIGFGVLTCDDEEQALDRAGLDGSGEDKGYDVTAATLQTATTLRDLSHSA